jgi:hypothetical protein
VVRVHWAFDDGLTQTYTFEYAEVGPGATPEELGAGPDRG